jgi:hypothetical protein
MHEIQQRKVKPELEKLFKNLPPIPNKENRDQIEEKLLAKLSNNKKFNRYLSREKKEQITKIIAHTVVDACRNLAIPIPDIKIVTFMNSNGMGFEMSQWRINITEDFLKDINTKKLFTINLRLYLYHECYHGWQAIHIPKRTKLSHEFFKDRQDDENIDLLKLISKAEITAELYALKQVKNIKIGSPKALLEKSLAILDLLTRISYKKLKRKNLKPKY